MSDPMEEHEHAEHAAHAGKRQSALLIAVLAAGLAFAERGAQNAATEMSADAIAATDLWNQYQAKSVRSAQARNFADFAQVAAPAGPAREALVARLLGDVTHYDADKVGIGKQARAKEAARDAAHSRQEGYETASAALQLGIVMTTAAVITDATPLLLVAVVLGLAGAVMGGLAAAGLGF